LISSSAEKAGIVSLAGLVVATANNEIIPVAAARLQADVMISFKGIPIETIRHIGKLVAGCEHQSLGFELGSLRRHQLDLAARGVHSR
jgi:hypothetical protein